MKNKITTLLLAAALASFSTPSFAALNGGDSEDVLSGGSATSSTTKSFSETAAGAGLAIGVRFNLAQDVFTDSEELDARGKIQNSSSKTKDHIFTELEVFGNQFFSGEIKQNLGGRVNLGYEFHGIRVFGSGGYVNSSVDYQEVGNPVQSVSESAPFFGFGLGYDITKNVGIRLNSMFYNFDFTPKDSAYTNIEVDVSAVTLGLSLHF